MFGEGLGRDLLSPRGVRSSGLTGSGDFQPDAVADVKTGILAEFLNLADEIASHSFCFQLTCHGGVEYHDTTVPRKRERPVGVRRHQPKRIFTFLQGHSRGRDDPLGVLRPLSLLHGPDHLLNLLADPWAERRRYDLQLELSGS